MGSWGCTDGTGRSAPARPRAPRRAGPPGVGGERALVVRPTVGRGQRVVDGRAHEGAEHESGRSTPMPDSVPADWSTIAVENDTAARTASAYAGRSCSDTTNGSAPISTTSAWAIGSTGAGAVTAQWASRSRARSTLVPVNAIAGWIASGIAPADRAGRRTSTPWSDWCARRAGPAARSRRPPALHESGELVVRTGRRAARARCARPGRGSRGRGTGEHRLGAVAARVGHGRHTDDGVLGVRQGPPPEHRFRPAPRDDADAESSGPHGALGRRGTSDQRPGGTACVPRRPATFPWELRRRAVATTCPSGACVAGVRRASRRASGAWCRPPRPRRRGARSPTRGAGRRARPARRSAPRRDRKRCGRVRSRAGATPARAALLDLDALHARQRHDHERAPDGLRDGAAPRPARTVAVAAEREGRSQAPRRGECRTRASPVVVRLSSTTLTASDEPSRSSSRDAVGPATAVPTSPGRSGG